MGRDLGCMSDGNIEKTKPTRYLKTEANKHQRKAAELSWLAHLPLKVGLTGSNPGLPRPWVFLHNCVPPCGSRRWRVVLAGTGRARHGWRWTEGAEGKVAGPKVPKVEGAPRWAEGRLRSGPML